MASSRSNKSSKSKSSSSGLRILWIPGGRKSHPKGRFDSTNKQISYLNRQKKSEVWSLGGGTTQKNLINAESDTALLDGPSVSSVNSLRPLTCTVSALGVAQCAQLVDLNATPQPPATTTTTAEVELTPTTPVNITSNSETPLTPGSSSSTAPLISVPNSPEPETITTTTTTTEGKTTEGISTVTTSTTTIAEMPAKTTTPVIKTSTTTIAEIIDENRFALLAKNITDEVDVYSLPIPPQDDLNARGDGPARLLNSSNDTAASTPTTSSPSNSPRGENGSGDGSPTKKKSRSRNHNNNQQDDINSIESISDHNTPKGILLPSLDWMDDLMLKQQSDEFLQKAKKKKKKKHSTSKELDQLDGVPVKSSTLEMAPSQNKIKDKDTFPDEEDEKVVKCLYYTLMCCDCSIS